MAVPDTTTFDLQDVVDEINPTTDDLTDCFADANSTYFNSTYKSTYYIAAGDKNNLLMFRDYGDHNTNSIYADPTYIFFDGDGATETATITTLPDAYDFTVDSKPSWAFLITTNDTMSITVGSYSGSREGDIVIKHNDDSTKIATISLRQAGL